jgi:hypothetical protein
MITCDLRADCARDGQRSVSAQGGEVFGYSDDKSFVGGSSRSAATNTAVLTRFFLEYLHSID